MEAKKRIGAMISSGKDGWYAAYKMHQQGHELACIITLKSANSASYMFHVPNVDLVRLQAEATGIPLLFEETHGEKERELEDLERALRNAKEKFQLDGIVAGALFSEYQRARVAKIADKLGLELHAPLWHMDQEKELRGLLKEGFTIILSAIAADGLNKSWLGRPITEEDVDKLVQLNNKIGINIAFEGGEAESLVLDMPLFSKMLEVEESEIQEEDEHTAQLIIKKATLKNK